MDKYDATLARVIDETADGTVKWRMDHPDNYAAVILNSDRVIRAFTAKLPLGHKEFPLLFIEKKAPSRDEYDQLFEGTEFELYVLDDFGRIVLPVYEGLVEERQLERLAELVSQSNEAAREFFDALESSGDG
ncbi:MAG: hypothetical protein HYS13_20120 [Planctomycetia bacterium]|nr:hypothetical protein [Planctomycetia bacterium]